MPSLTRRDRPVVLKREELARSGREGVDEMVQAGSQLVQTISEKDSPPPLLPWFKRLGLDGYTLPVRLVMNRDRLRGIYRARTTVDCGFQLIEVFFGSIHFQPNIVDCTHGINASS
jgi:hypothetical protein